MYVCMYGTYVWVLLNSYTPRQPLPPFDSGARSNGADCMRHGLCHFLDMPHNEEVVCDCKRRSQTIFNVKVYAHLYVFIC